MSLRSVRVGFVPVIPSEATVIVMIVGLIVGLCLAVCSPAGGYNVNKVAATKSCIRDLLAKFNSDPLRRQWDYHKLQTSLVNETTAGGKRWSLTNYSFTNLENYTIEDEAVREEGNDLKVTFSVRWTAVVAVSMVATRVQEDSRVVDCKDNPDLAYCKNYKGKIRAYGQVTGRPGILIINLAGAGELIYVPNEPVASSITYYVDKAADIMVAFLMDDENYNLDEALGSPSKTLKKQLTSYWSRRLNLFLTEVIRRIDTSIRSISIGCLNENAIF